MKRCLWGRYALILLGMTQYSWGKLPANFAQQIHDVANTAKMTRGVISGQMKKLEEQYAVYSFSEAKKTIAEIDALLQSIAGKSKLVAAMLAERKYAADKVELNGLAVELNKPSKDLKTLKTVILNAPIKQEKAYWSSVSGSITKLGTDLEMVLKNLEERAKTLTEYKKLVSERSAKKYDVSLDSIKSSKKMVEVAKKKQPVKPVEPVTTPVNKPLPPLPPVAKPERGKANTRNHYSCCFLSNLTE